MQSSLQKVELVLNIEIRAQGWKNSWKFKTENESISNPLTGRSSSKQENQDNSTNDTAAKRLMSLNNLYSRAYRNISP